MRLRSQAPPLSKRPSGADELGRVAELFRMVADRTTAGILYALADAGELTLAELAVAVAASEHSVLGALRTLRNARMVVSRRDGEVINYSLRGSDVKDLLCMAASSIPDPQINPSRRRAVSRASARR